MKEAKDDTIRDAAMLAAAQAVRTLRDLRYGTLVAWAAKMEISDAAELLQATLDEEKLTDQKPTDLAEMRPKPPSSCTYRSGTCGFATHSASDPKILSWSHANGLVRDRDPPGTWR